MDPDPFSAPAAVASYLERARRAVPGLSVVQGLAEELLAESLPERARVLVVGAGGGLELTLLAGRHPDWTFDGVDPSAPMLDLARATMGPLAERARLHHGYVDDVPEGPFDGATCLLTLHFLDAPERLATLREIRRRLRPGAPLLTFHHSVPDDGSRLAWFARFARHAEGPAADPARIVAGAESHVTQLPLLTPEQDEALLRDAGFRDVGQFYAALTLRGWLAFA